MTEPESTETTRLDVTEIETGEVVHSVDVRGRSEREIERILMGMLVNADSDRYFIAEATTPPGEAATS